MKPKPKIKPFFAVSDHTGRLYYQTRKNHCFFFMQNKWLRSITDCPLTEFGIGKPITKTLAKKCYPEAFKVRLPES